ncbi:MAG: hypothetical protein OXD47_00305 [Gammaproteobacteria bacterium]|nr:hypothetical protein [Gammaproteobacteria bacterium]MCY4210096.1 hypothetical protein [Gammaproteobacteria bacterium]MCY4282016.1 hypothetical protein [Gammaproteobacteria bacterium]MCY4337225.1 hypothetical protein [Gammaproteobacteria bacterium]
MYALGMTGLIAAYVLVALLLLSINLYSNWSWQVKAGSIVVTTLLYVVTYLSFPPLLGWPSGDLPPQRFRLVGADVVQPDKMTGEQGMVYLWVKDIKDLSGRTPPRAHKLPYSSDLHEAVLSAKSKLDRGMEQLGEFQLPLDANAREVDTLIRGGQQSVEIDFYDIPDPLIPDK